MKQELNLSPQDNKKLANLCGPLDENMWIGVGLDVKISRKNSLFIFDGDEKKVLLASQLLEYLFKEQQDLFYSRGHSIKALLS